MSKKRIVILALLMAEVIGLLVLYSRQDESKKRFIKHMVRQVPYMPGRYFA